MTLAAGPKVSSLTHDLTDRGVLLTGASSGIGRELAKELAGQGARLAIAARRVERLRDLSRELASAMATAPVVLPADLSQPGAAKHLATRALAELGQIDVLINNAGMGAGGLQWRVGDREPAREMFEANLWSPLALVEALVPAMRERGSGAVVNITSIAQVLTLWGLGHYAASKAALALATETLRLELTGSDVHVLEVIVGPTNTAVQGETRLIAGAEDALKGSPLGDSKRLAALIVSALERRRRRIVYPRALQLLYSFPPAARLYMPLLARRLARQGKLDLDDRRVIRGGSCGDDTAREAREQWERERMTRRPSSA